MLTCLCPSSAPLNAPRFPANPKSRFKIRKYPNPTLVPATEHPQELANELLAFDREPVSVRARPLRSQLLFSPGNALFLLERKFRLLAVRLAGTSHHWREDLLQEMNLQVLPCRHKHTLAYYHGMAKHAAINFLRCELRHKAVAEKYQQHRSHGLAEQQAALDPVRQFVE